MIYYYALWIPSYKEEVPTIQREKLNEIILQDIPGSDTIRLKGKINKESFNIHLQYLINNGGWSDLFFRFVDKQQDGFIFYSLEVGDNEVKKDVMHERLLSRGLHKSIYHYFKEFFHTHSLHAEGEDSLLPVYTAREPIDWADDRVKYLIITPIIKAYTAKFRGFYRLGRNDLQSCMTAISQNREVTKNIHALRGFLHDGYKVKREKSYCDFLLSQYSTIIDRRVQRKLEEAYNDFFTYYADLDFWYHAYLDTISFRDSKVSKRWGITGGCLGLLSIAITLFLECSSSNSGMPDEQLLRADSLILIKQDYLIEKVDELTDYCKPDTL